MAQQRTRRRFHGGTDAVGGGVNHDLPFPIFGRTGPGDAVLSYRLIAGPCPNWRAEQAEQKGRDDCDDLGFPQEQELSPPLAAVSSIDHE